MYVMIKFGSIAVPDYHFRYHISIDALVEARSEETTQVDSLIQFTEADQTSKDKSV